MGRAVALREDFDGPALRRLAKASKDAGQSRRLLALAEIYDGGRRTEVARIGTVGLQVVRDWVLRFNAKGPDGLIDGKATGKPAKLNDRQRQALARLVESGPIPAIHGVVRWRRKDLAHWIFEEFRISVDETTVGRGDASHRNARNWPPSRISSTVFWRRTERFTVSSTTRRSVYSSAFATNMASRAKRPS